MFLTENSPAIALVEKAGLFAPVDQATLDQVPAAYRPSTGAWTGIAARSTVFAYNPTLLPEAELPASLLDLQEPAWKGRWAASPSGADFQAIVSALLALEGQPATEAWLARHEDELHGLPGQPDGDGRRELGRDPRRGDLPLLLVRRPGQHRREQRERQAALLQDQDPGAFVSVSGGGVLESSQNPAAAQAFLEFITGVDGQTILQTGDSFEYAIASDVAANPALVPLVDLEAPVIDPSTLDSTVTSDLMTQAGIL